MTRSSDNGECATPDCPNKPKRNGRCWRCVKHRKRHGVYPSLPKRTWGDPHGTLMNAIKRRENVDTSAAADSEFNRAEASFKMALARYVEHKKGAE